MPTFNQLVRFGRQKVSYKSKSPALQVTMNSLKKETVDISCPQKRGVCTKAGNHELSEKRDR